MASYLLGINTGTHDRAAALLRNGELVAMAEQERFNRHKRSGDQFPVDAARFCLDRERIGLADLDAVAVGWDEPLYAAVQGEPFDEKKFLGELFPSDRFDSDQMPPVHMVRHHAAHAASAFWPSGFDEGLILVLDGRGETESTTVAFGDGSRIETLAQYGIDRSLGILYATAAEWCGLEFEDAGKFMGLSSYGRPVQEIPLSYNGTLTIPGLKPSPPEPRDHPFHLYSFLKNHFRDHNYPFSKGDERDVFTYANFAASVQRALEDCVLNLARHFQRKTGAKKLMLAGGVGLNCSMNRRIAESGTFEEIFIQPAAHDAGVSLGAACHVHHELFGHGASRWTMEHAYWGPDFGEAEIESALRAADLDFQRLTEPELLDRSARVLHEGGILGWFQGRAEIGPRALGARSILGNPCRREHFIRVNLLKGRELWRPLAPSVLESEFENYFSAAQSSPFMIIAARVRSAVQSRIPAVVHVDESARPQAVCRESNPRYWSLISKFGELSGVPVVLNTSFNLRGEPIVNTPADAIRDFQKTDMDALAIGNFLVIKEPSAGPSAIPGSAGK